MADRTGYDYVIVGAGSAGCVLAYRLTADPAIRVLLLEAGGRDTHPLIHVPIGLGKIWEHRMFDWGYDTEPEPRLDGRRIEAERGKVLGGSSSVNVMAYVRGRRRVPAAGLAAAQPDGRDERARDARDPRGIARDGRRIRQGRTAPPRAGHARGAAGRRRVQHAAAAHAVGHRRAGASP